MTLEVLDDAGGSGARHGALAGRVRGGRTDSVHADVAVVLGFVSDGYTLWDEWIEYSPISQPISGLGMGATAWVMNGSFVLLGVLVIVGASAICAELPGLTGPVRRTSAGLLGLVGVGAIIDGVFNLESMLMHAAGFALVISTIVGFPIVGLKLRGIPEWRSLGLGLAIAGPVTLVLAISYFCDVRPDRCGRWRGDRRGDPAGPGDVDPRLVRSVGLAGRGAALCQSEC
jgi:hypothetical membrane protein